MGYASPNDLQARYPNRDLIQISNEDPTVTTVNAAFLQTRLDDASTEIDAYLEARFALPLLDPPSILTRLCCEIAMYHLQALRPIHDLAYIKDQYEKTLSFLDDVANGKRTLGLATDSAEPTDPTNPAVVWVDAGGTGSASGGILNTGGEDIVSGVSIGGLPHRVFSRGSMRGF
jgi:phage gp36-like protein